MNRALLLFLLLLPGLKLSAQDCSNYFFLQSGKTIEMTHYNKKGKESGKHIMEVRQVSRTARGYKGQLHTRFYDASGKLVMEGDNQMQCRDGQLQMDMTMMMPQQGRQGRASVNTEAFYLEYPASMKVGDVLPDGNMVMDMETNGMQQNLQLQITDRKVTGREQVSSPAGSWNCYRISYTGRMKMTMGGVGIPVSYSATEWLAPGVGIVKTETKTGSTLITAIR